MKSLVSDEKYLIEVTFMRLKLRNSNLRMYCVLPSPGRNSVIYCHCFRFWKYEISYRFLSALIRLISHTTLHFKVSIVFLPTTSFPQLRRNFGLLILTYSFNKKARSRLFARLSNKEEEILHNIKTDNAWLTPYKNLNKITHILHYLRYEYNDFPK